VQAYRFFYPSVSIMATWKGNLRAGMVANKVCYCTGPAAALCCCTKIVKGRSHDRNRPLTWVGATGIEPVTPSL
jgi:hypothetical protein